MYVTDTHPFVYSALSRRARLGAEARRLFSRADRGEELIYIPSIVLWEVAMLIRLKKISLPQRFDHWCRGMHASVGFSIEPLEWTDVDEARRLPFSDPHDCLIVGTALRLGMPLITKDRAITESGLVETAW